MRNNNSHNNGVGGTIVFFIAMLISFCLCATCCSGVKSSNDDSETNNTSESENAYDTESEAYKTGKYIGDTIGDALNNASSEMEESFDYVEFLQGDSNFDKDWISAVNKNEYKLMAGNYTFEILGQDENPNAAKCGNIMIEDITQTDETGYVVIYNVGPKSAPYSEDISIEENNLIYLTANEYVRITKLN